MTFLLICAGIALLLTGLGLLIWLGGRNRETPSVSISRSLAGGASVNVTGYKASEVPLLVLDATAYYLMAQEKAKSGIRAGVHLSHEHPQPSRVPGQPRPHVVKD